MGKVTLPKGFDPAPVTHWYVLANRTEARIYGGSLNGGFHYIKRMRNPKGRLLNAAIGSERPGRKFSSARSGVRHGLENQENAHEEVALKFAKRIAKTLDKAVLSQDCTDLVMVAEPHFLGLMNREMPKRVKETVRLALPKEWKRGSDEELEKYLKKQLA